LSSKSSISLSWCFLHQEFRARAGPCIWNGCGSHSEVEPVAWVPLGTCRIPTALLNHNSWWVLTWLSHPEVRFWEAPWTAGVEAQLDQLLHLLSPPLLPLQLGSGWDTVRDSAQFGTHSLAHYWWLLFICFITQAIPGLWHSFTQLT
jgi:hypothetical protein